jgi:hypothetical protein
MPVSSGARLNRPYIVVGQAEVMPGLVHQQMGNDGSQGLLVLGPVIEFRGVASRDGVSEKKSPAEYARGKLRSPLTVAKEGTCRSLPGRVS